MGQPLNLDDAGSIRFTQVVIELTKQGVEYQKLAAEEAKRSADILTGNKAPARPAGSSYPPPGAPGYGYAGYGYAGYGYAGYGAAYPAGYPGGYGQPAPAKPDPMIERARETSMARAFKDAQKDLYDKAGTLGNVGMHGLASATARTGGLAAGVKDLGFAGAGTLLSRAAVPLAVASGTIDAAAGVARVANDPFATSEQMGRRLVAQTAIGRKLQGWMDDFTGRAYEMELADVRGKFGGADVQARLGTSGFNLGNAPRVAGLETRAQAFAQGSAVVPGAFDRTTGLGEQAFRDEMRLLPYRQASARADRESQVATAERVAAEREFARIKEREMGLLKEQTRLTRELDNPRWGEGSGAVRQEKIRSLQNVQLEIRGLLDQERAAREAVTERREREASARGEAERAKVREQMLGQADVLEARAERGAAGAKSLARMNPMERAMTAQAVRLVQQYGPGALPPEILSRAEAAAPTTIGKVLENYGAGTAAFKDLQRSAPADFPTGRPGDLQRQADDLRRRAGEQEYAIDAQAAGEIARANRGLGKFIAGIINQAAEQTKREILNEIRVGRNQ